MTDSPANLAAMHRRTAERFGPRPALRYKRDGLYHDLSWEDYRDQADAAAAGLVELGVAPGDRIGLLSDNCLEWLIADIAILTCGAVNVPLHAALAPPQVEYQLGHSEARVALVRDQAQADKVLAVRDRLSGLELLIGFEPVEADGRVRSISWEGLKQLGRTSPRACAEVRRREADLRPEALATLMYTSGTTGLPKGVMLTHGNLVSNAAGTLAAATTQQDDIALSWLPYSHIYSRTVDHYLSILAGGTIALAESIDTLIVNLAEIEPTWMTSVPRFYEKVWARVEQLPPAGRAGALRAIFGRRLRMLSSGGAPLPKHICVGFWEAGIEIYEGYGLTESSPVITFNRTGNARCGTVGQAIPEVEIRIAPDGEILTRGPHVMAGYWKNPEATRAAIVDDWLHTGDIGRLDDDGFLTITDRKKDLIVTSGGKNIAPSELERLLTSDPYIDQAVVYGDGKHFITALLVPSFDQLEAKARELGCPIEATDNIITTPALYQFFAERVKAVMAQVSAPERVKEFLILARPFQMAAGELTASLKVRRRHIIDQYRDRLDEIYRRSSPSDQDG